MQPTWLFAIAGIVIPVIIHFWNIRDGKILQVGSILLLKETATQQARSLRLKDILLLILRCLLIIVLAFLIAKPQWKKQLSATSEKGWIMMEKQCINETYKNFKPIIDSLIMTGYKFHYFKKGFKPGNLKDALKASDDTSTEVDASYWALLKQLNEQVPAELPVYLFTDDKLRRFAGRRPELQMNLKWMTYTSRDTVIKYIAKAYKTISDSIRVIVANSKPAATINTFENVALTDNNSHFLLINKNNKVFLSGRDSTLKNSVQIDTTTININIYTDQYTTDANYLKAAIDAIEQYTGLKIKASVINNINAINPGTDWLFWLSEKALPFQQLPSKVFIYEKGKEQQIYSWIIPAHTLSIDKEDVQLSRFIQNNSTARNNFETLWKDGFGHPLLTLEKTGNNYTYYFYSRFNPSWNDLPWNSHFVEMVFDLLVEPDPRIKKFDNRIIDKAQLHPEIAKEGKAFGKQDFVETVDITEAFWLLAFIIFCIERYISLTNKHEVYA